MTVGRVERYDDVIHPVKSLESMEVTGILMREGTNFMGPKAYPLLDQSRTNAETRLAQLSFRLT